jgi:hypothetical protein
VLAEILRALAIRAWVSRLRRNSTIAKAPSRRNGARAERRAGGKVRQSIIRAIGLNFLAPKSLVAGSESSPDASAPRREKRRITDVIPDIVVAQSFESVDAFKTRWR